MGRKLNDNRLRANLHQVQDKVDRAYEEARAVGYDRPIIAVLDLRDVNARTIARRYLGQDPVETQVAKARQLDKRPNLIAVLERAEAIELLAPIFPKLARGLVAPGPVEGYLAVVIGARQGMVAEVSPPVNGLVDRVRRQP